MIAWQKCEPQKEGVEDPKLKALERVEGACKSMIGRRLKQTNAQWNVDRLNEMAVLCSVHYSDLWKKYWSQAR